MNCPPEFMRLIKAVGELAESSEKAQLAQRIYEGAKQYPGVEVKLNAREFATVKAALKRHPDYAISAVITQPGKPATYHICLRDTAKNKYTIC